MDTIQDIRRQIQNPPRRQRAIRGYSAPMLDLAWCARTWDTYDALVDELNTEIERVSLIDTVDGPRANDQADTQFAELMRLAIQASALRDRARNTARAMAPVVVGPCADDPNATLCALSYLADELCPQTALKIQFIAGCAAQVYALVDGLDLPYSDRVKMELQDLG